MSDEEHEDIVENYRGRVRPVSAEPDLKQIFKAVQESGYLMEQEVASTIEKHGLHVFTSVAFEDPDEGKSREMDIRAIISAGTNKQSSTYGYVEIIAECKNSSNPIVFIARPKNQADKHEKPQEYFFPYEYQAQKPIEKGGYYVQTTPAFKHLGYSELGAESRPEWKAVQFCRIDRKGGGWHANHGGLYDAIFYPLAKALTARLKEVKKHNNRQHGPRYIWLFLPLVITSGDLYLIDVSSPDHSPQKVDKITFKREIKSKSISGEFNITFVRQSHLSAFLKDVIDPLVHLTTGLIEDKEDFLSSTEIPWVDRA